MKTLRAEILSNKKLGEFQALTLVAPEIADKARPGQFVSVAMPEGREFYLRRHLAIHQASRRGGWAGTLELVVDPKGPGTTWLSSVKSHDGLEMIGPLGKPFQYPKKQRNCLLIAEDHRAATMYFLAQELLSRGNHVDMIVAAGTLDRVFKPIEGKRLSRTIAILTADGTLGERGTVMDSMGSMIDRCRTEVVYASAGVATLRDIAALCAERGIPSQVSVEDRMGCGTGLCNTCVVPMAGADGSLENVRSCVEGPVFDPARIAWSKWHPPAAQVIAESSTSSAKDGGAGQSEGIEG